MIDLESDHASSERDTAALNPDNDEAANRRINIAMGRCMLFYIACIIVFVAIFIVIRSA